jgi:hypothetical protein
MCAALTKGRQGYEETSLSLICQYKNVIGVSCSLFEKSASVVFQAYRFC